MLTCVLPVDNSMPLSMSRLTMTHSSSDKIVLTSGICLYVRSILVLQVRHQFANPRMCRYRSKRMIYLFQLLNGYRVHRWRRQKKSWAFFNRWNTKVLASHLTREDAWEAERRMPPEEVYARDALLIIGNRRPSRILAPYSRLAELEELVRSWVSPKAY
jgi:hypothetical protein